LLKNVRTIQKTILLYACFGPNHCHNPTNNPKQLKTTFVGVVLLSVRKTTITTTTPPWFDYNLSHFKAT
jgi:hypothetical protein